MASCDSIPSGPVCKNRIEELIKNHKKKETKKRQATGSAEEIDQFCENMEEISMRQDCLSCDKVISTKALKRKDDLEDQGEQIRDAAMQGLARMILVHSIIR